MISMILQYIKNHKWYLILSVMTVNIISQLFKLVTYRNLTEYINLVSSLSNSENIFLTFFIKLLIVHLIQNFCKYFLEYIISIEIKQLFKKILERIIKNSMNTFKKDIHNKVNQIWLYINNIQVMMIKLLIDLPIILTFISHYIYITYCLYPQIILYIIPINIFIILALHPFSKKQYELQKDRINIETDTKNKLLEVTSNIEFVKLNNREEHEVKRISESYKKYICNKIKDKGIEFQINFLYQLYNDFLILIIYSIGSIYLMEKILNPIDLIYLIVNTGNFCYQIMQLKEIFNYYRRTKSKLQIIEQLSNFKENQENEMEKHDIDLINRDVEFRKITFSYDGMINVINKLSFKFYGNEINLLLGPNGSGKSTLIKLLLRLYNLKSYPNGDTNKIFFGGSDITDIKIKELREKIIFVSQEPYIFNESVIYNIKYGNENISDDKIIDLCDILYSRDWLLQNMNTSAGPRGRNLSGGEKKKIQLINAICKNAEVIIFDEPTNTLDSNAIKWFIDFIKLLKNKYKKTIIIITHDLRLKDVADKVIDLNKN